MTDNIIGLKSVRELLGMYFYVPNYQRGYRWTEQQVEDLLNDIRDFKLNEKLQPYQFYCVQPLVVRKMADGEIVEKSLGQGVCWYEVIDGQQRLTTIYLILRALKEKLNKKHFLPQLYTLKYQRENRIESFFNNPEMNDSEIDDSEIDLYHISSAYKTINSWLEKYLDFGENLLESFICYIDESGRDKANNVRFIWYESVDENPIKVFTRLNIGKISLTNAELIKAMILNRNNIAKQNISDIITLRQQEIASEWDTIEYQLQKDEFWLFLNKPGYQNPTRIDYIFNLMCDNNVLHLDVGKLESIGNDKNRTFRYFYEYFKQPNSDVITCWKKVKKYFSTFKEWYDDVLLYHYIGFLVCQGYDAHSLSKEWDNAATKTSFVNHLKEQIKNIVTKIPLSHQYDVDGKNKGVCRPILLFHNIQSVINRNIAQIENDKYKLAVFYKFPFHLYKREGWDVEHINSNTTNPEEDSATREEWLTNIYLSVPEEIQKKIEKYFLTTSGEEKNKIYSDIKSEINIKSLIPSKDDWDSETKNRIWNYTLLDSSTNRGYGNAIFSAKRRIIIGKDKGELLKIPKITADGLVMIDANKGKSSFVPPCTKNVFLKFYSPSVSENNYWTISDAEYYLKDIEHCIQQLNEPATLEK